MHDYPLLFLIWLVPLASAQYSITSDSPDIRDVNGGPMAGVRSTIIRKDGDTRISETRRSLNGVNVPAERVEEKVLQDAAGVKVVERVIQRYDPNGNPLPREKQVTTTITASDGSTHQEQNAWQGDLNGNLSLAARTVIDTRKSGSVTTTAVAVQRPSLNASLDVVEKREVVKTETAKGVYTQDESVWRNGQSGFYQAVRRVTDHQEQAGSISENTAEYEIGMSGSLELHSQVIRNTTKGPGGNDVTEVNYLERSAPGQAISGSDAGLRLRAQEIVERIPGNNGEFREVVSVRRPTIADPARLSAPQRVAEISCKGDCPHP